jgi:hypothetical protein
MPAGGAEMRDATVDPVDPLTDLSARSGFC